MDVSLFDVVGDEPVVLLAAEVKEVAPDVQGLLLEEDGVRGGERAFFFLGRSVEPLDDEWGDEPEEEDWCRGEDGVVVFEEEGDGAEEGDDGGELEVPVHGGARAVGFSLGGCLPLEEELSGDEGSYEGPIDGIEREHHVVGEEGKAQRGEAEGGGEGGDALSQADEAEAGDGAREVEEELHEYGEDEDDDGGYGPVEGTAGENEPSEEEHEEGEGLCEAATEVVEDLEAGDGADGVFDEAAGLIWNLAEEPLGDLPVSTDPAVFAAGVGGVVGGVVVDDFDVCDEAGAGVGAFDEVVGEEGVAGESAVEDLMEDADFVDAFSGEDAFAEEVLIDVGDGAGVDVEAGLSRVEGGEAGA